METSWRDKFVLRHGPKYIFLGLFLGLIENNACNELNVLSITIHIL